MKKTGKRREEGAKRDGRKENEKRVAQRYTKERKKERNKEEKEMEANVCGKVKELCTEDRIYFRR